MLADIKGVGDATLKKLKSLDIDTTERLINFLPKSYIDFNNPVSVQNAEDGNFCLFRLHIRKVGRIVSTRGGLKFFSADAVDIAEKENPICKNQVKLTWYNQPYLLASVKAENDYLCFGKVKWNGKKIELTNPSLELMESAKKMKGIMPVYRTRGIVKQGTFYSLIGEALKVYSPNEIITREVCQKRNLTPLQQAFISAHFPTSLQEGYDAQKRIALEDTVKEIIYYKILNKGAAKSRTIKYGKPFSEVDGFIKSLPYELTESQKKALNEIRSDLNSDRKMSRILIGDVGSGKTVVALISMLYAVKCGYQAAIMAPTEILAQQHFRTAQALFGAFGINVAFHGGSVKGAERKRVEEEIATGEADIIVGTHSLFQKGITFHNLALAVIDEQHKFGVAQKYNLLQKGENVDTLTLTATPIPRSVLMLLYDELQLSEIEKKRTFPVKTFLVSDAKKEGLFGFIKDEVEKGGQAFVVCPKIYDGEGLETYSAASLYDELSKGVFSGIRTALIHGKMKADDKNKVMERFAAGEIDVLVSTTVVEVGIDVKNATVIAVLNADRFGLATLHQLRGRVGRGDKKSYCFLHTTTVDNERLRALTECDDGFKLAELDFTLRGGGDYLGARQSGETDGGKYAVPVTPSVIMEAREIAVDDLLPGGIVLSEDDFAYFRERLKDITFA